MEIWVEECVEKAVAADPKINKEKVRQSCRRAATEHDLDGDFRIKLESGQWVCIPGHLDQGIRITLNLFLLHVPSPFSDEANSSLVGTRDFENGRNCNSKLVM